jgi:hypothetical protein
MARRSPHRHDVQVMGFAPLAAFLDEVGLMGPIARRMWKRTHFLAGPVVDVADAPSDGATDEVYDGPAVLRIGETDHTTRVRLAGHLDPIDGQYHWQGTVFDALPDDVLKQPKVSLTVGGRTVQARITERTPQGVYGVSGVGAPPFG